MINENLVDFELYAGAHVAYSLGLLEEFAKIGYDTLTLKNSQILNPKRDTTVLKPSMSGLNESWLHHLHRHHHHHHHHNNKKIKKIC
jgi:hypothetical protein